MIVNGIVKDVSTGETLPGATIYKVSNLISTPLTSTDANGQFSAYFAPGDKIKASFVGFQDTIIEAKTNITIGLLEDSQSVGAITVTGQKTPKTETEKDSYIFEVLAVGLILVAAVVAYFYYFKK